MSGSKASQSRCSTGITLTLRIKRYIRPASHHDAAKSTEMDMDDSPSRRCLGRALQIIAHDALAVRRAMDLDPNG
jgi:hypothetical protein